MTEQKAEEIMNNTPASGVSLLDPFGVYRLQTQIFNRTMRAFNPFWPF